ncbi:MAG: hypothetical protein KQI81_08740 [Deltaproteobacteria bacterium]|nr:hypothetical protein [Deltaproteobacteria bacterium]
MPTIKELREHIQGYDDDKVVAYAIWSGDDIDMMLGDELEDEDDKDPTDTQLLSVLTQEDKNTIINNMHHAHDCNYGLTWDHLRSELDDLLDEKLKQCCTCEQTFTTPGYPGKECPHCGSGNWVYGYIDEAVQP